MILIINGPNLNLLGTREPDIYGLTSFEDYLPELRQQFSDRTIDYFQSNWEGGIIDAIHKAGADPACEGIVINPGAYSHYSLAIADAMAAIAKPIVEVHISNIHGREEYRRRSVTAEKADGIIAGLGLYGYSAAINYLTLSCLPN